MIRVIRIYLYQTYPFKYSLVRQAIKFCIVGGIAAAINFSFLFLLTEYLDFWYIVSAGTGFVVSAIFNFIANKFWTFRNNLTGPEIWRQVMKFIFVMVSGLFINLSLIYALTEFLGLDYRMSWIFATAAVTIWNFIFNRFWTFRVKAATDLGLPIE